ncbi:hypothetical protein BD311DRAFT_651235 [Dichomitus squalens]|uniref:Endopeptidase S2P n=1 Tax=Dichomitus squalens TaxID=114155 RepID=A0A4Q9N523_9APHY|nr:hypothetical protein BD311DRAFT_651235 [Dichomitus squalens]
MVGGLQNFLFSLSLFWAVLYALRHYRRRRTSNAAFLPAPTSSTKSLSCELLRSRTTRITLSKFHIGVYSTAFNNVHQHFAARLKHSRWKRLLGFAYDAGSLLGVLGMLGSVLLLLWTTLHLVSSAHVIKIPISSAPRTFHKREELVGETSLSSENSSRDAPLQLIIPGVTTPLHHLPILLAALSASQIIHEAGHAVAAALDSVLLRSAGLGFTFILPSAFVSFSAGETESLSPRSRLRLISAGAYHNLLFWLFLSGIAWTNVSHYVWTVLGYQDVSAYGQVVVHIDENSPLYGHMPVGLVVYKVGDDTLDDPQGAPSRWEFLLSNKRDGPASTLGWCTDEPWFAVQNATCCTTRPSSSEVSLGQSCFAPIADPSFERCVDPLLFLDASDTRRCSSVVDCGHGQLCVRPRGDQELVSLTMHLPPWLRNGSGADDDVERRLVWQGDTSEILHEVEVGDWLPSYGVLPIGLPVLWDNLFLCVP